MFFFYIFFLYISSCTFVYTLYHLVKTILTRSGSFIFMLYMYVYQWYINQNAKIQETKLDTY
jgi:hypothetical protein